MKQIYNTMVLRQQYYTRISSDSHHEYTRVTLATNPRRAAEKAFSSFCTGMKKVAKNDYYNIYGGYDRYGREDPTGQYNKSRVKIQPFNFDKDAAGCTAVVDVFDDKSFFKSYNAQRKTLKKPRKWVFEEGTDNERKVEHKYKTIVKPTTGRRTPKSTTSNSRKLMREYHVELERGREVVYEVMLGRDPRHAAEKAFSKQCRAMKKARKMEFEEEIGEGVFDPDDDFDDVAMCMMFVGVSDDHGQLADYQITRELLEEPKEAMFGKNTKNAKKVLYKYKTDVQRVYVS
jgi:hypothetical protein